MILSDFESAGYRAVFSVLRATDYGVPQNRERVFLLGMRKDLNHDLSLFPPPTDAHRTEFVSGSWVAPMDVSWRGTQGSSRSS